MDVQAPAVCYTLPFDSKNIENFVNKYSELLKVKDLLPEFQNAFYSELRDVFSFRVNACLQACVFVTIKYYIYTSVHLG